MLSDGLANVGKTEPDAIATDVTQEIPDHAIEASLQTLRTIKHRIKGLAEPPGSIAAK